MMLVQYRPYPVGKQTTLFYIDEHYKVQPFTVTKEMVESGSVRLPKLPYDKADYELYIKDGQVFTDHFDGVIVTYTEKETGEVHEPFACGFLSWELRDIFPKLGKILREKIKQDNKERYPLVAFVDAKTSEILVEIPIGDYYTNHKGLLELEKVVKLNSNLKGSDIVVKSYDKETDDWILFELRRLDFWRALDDTKAQVQEQVIRWKEDL